MPREIREIQSLPFYQIIGAPLLAIVQGQSQAAQATAEFISRIGFQKESGNPEDSSFGSMRMVSFTMQKPDEFGNPQKYSVELPLLSLVPIPAIQVKDAEVEFNVKITDTISTDTRTALSESGKDEGDWLSKGRVEFRAAMGRMETASSESQSLDLQMKVKMRIEQADVTAGLSHLFRLMDQNVTSKKI